MSGGDGAGDMVVIYSGTRLEFERIRGIFINFQRKITKGDSMKAAAYGDSIEVCV